MRQAPDEAGVIPPFFNRVTLVGVIHHGGWRLGRADNGEQAIRFTVGTQDESGPHLHRIVAYGDLLVPKIRRVAIGTRVLIQGTLEPRRFVTGRKLRGGLVLDAGTVVEVVEVVLRDDENQFQIVGQPVARPFGYEKDPFAGDQRDSRNRRAGFTARRSVEGLTPREVPIGEEPGTDAVPPPRK